MLVYVAKLMRVDAGVKWQKSNSKQPPHIGHTPTVSTHHDGLKYKLQSISYLRRMSADQMPALQSLHLQSPLREAHTVSGHILVDDRQMPNSVTNIASSASAVCPV